MYLKGSALSCVSACLKLSSYESSDWPGLNLNAIMVYISLHVELEGGEVLRKYKP